MHASKQEWRGENGELESALPKPAAPPRAHRGCLIQSIAHPTSIHPMTLLDQAYYGKDMRFGSRDQSQQPGSAISSEMTGHAPHSASVFASAGRVAVLG